jgi:Protein of unknown function (DUF3631)
MNKQIKPIKFMPALRITTKDDVEVVNDVRAFFKIGPNHGADDGGEILQDIINTINKYLVISENDALLAALWAMYTHVFDAYRVTPYLLITSPVAICGKSTLLKVLKVLVFNQHYIDRGSTSALFRRIDRDRPTLLLNEADEFIKKGQDYEYLLNGGFEYEGQITISVPNKNGDWTDKSFSTYCAKAFASIGKSNFWDALLTRCLTINLKKKMENEDRIDFDGEDIDEEKAIKTRIETWAKNNIDTLKAMRKEKLDIKLINRDKDKWKPLLNIARLAGEKWYNKAMAAAVASIPVKEEDEELSIGLQLLRDCRFVYNIEAHKQKEYLRGLIPPEDKLHGERGLVEWLWTIEGSGWDTYVKNKPITLNWLAKELKPYGIKSERCTTAGPDHGRAVWYRYKFEDAWARYLPKDFTTSTASDEQKDTKPNLSVTLEGEKVCVKEWSRRNGICVHNGIEISWDQAEILVKQKHSVRKVDVMDDRKAIYKIF